MCRENAFVERVGRVHVTLYANGTMDEMLINSATTAEKDTYLIECFHDAGFLKTLIAGEYSILAGRKGAGKTAISRYLEKKYADHSLLASLRISITSFTEERIKKGVEETREKVILFILLKTARHLYDQGLLESSTRPYWEAVFSEAGLDDSSNYQGFQTVQRKSSIGASLMGLLGKTEETRNKTVPEITSDSIFSSLQNSLERFDNSTEYLVFVDDISDYLDESKKQNITEDLVVIRDTLFRLDGFNTALRDAQKSLRFVVCVRDDLFEFMEGSNINKLKTNALQLTWDERSFASLLIRRLPHFRQNVEEALKNPVESIRALFPDEMFQTRLEAFDTKRYATNFYAYMVAISFNRPRDFLAFCYAMRERLSPKHQVVIENIDAAEIEYTDYFMAEIRDELYLASKIFDFKGDSKAVDRLVDILARKDGFNASQLRTDFSTILDEKTSLGRKRIEQFVYQLWWYGLLGFKEPREQLINFRYIALTSRFITEKAGGYSYYLHRGLWWFAKKRRGVRTPLEKELTETDVQLPLPEPPEQR